MNPPMFNTPADAVKYAFERRVSVEPWVAKVYIPALVPIYPLVLNYRVENDLIMRDFTNKFQPMKPTRSGLVVGVGPRTETIRPWFANPSDVYTVPEILFRSNINARLDGTEFCIALPRPTAVPDKMMYEIGFIVQCTNASCFSAPQVRHTVEEIRRHRDPFMSKFSDEYMRGLMNPTHTGLTDKDAMWEKYLQNAVVTFDYKKNMIIP